jgi:bacterioferritin-associated ferredoxin
VAEGTRVSAAALDLARAHEIEIRVTGPQAPDPAAAAEPLPQRPGPEKTGAPEEIKDLSEEELEDIVDRVMERFKALRGEKTEGEGDDLVICRCEEVTREEIREAIRSGMHTLNGIKRVTRAGMGLCQGQTCQRLVAQVLADELGLFPADLSPTTSRAPVRPVPLSVLATG